MRVTPSLLSKGEAACGEHPPDSLISEVFFQSYQDLSHERDAQVAGADARCSKSIRERLIVSMRISTKPVF
jgi:hypothetical protein